MTRSVTSASDTDQRMSMNDSSELGKRADRTDPPLEFPPGDGGSTVAAAQALDPHAGRVHNVPLLVAAELGLTGLFFWLWLVFAPFSRLLRPSSTLSPSPIQLAPWVAMIVMNLFDTTLWLGENWQTAVLFIVLAAHLVWPVNRS